MYLTICAAIIIFLFAASLLILRSNLSGAEAQDLSDPARLAGTRLEKYAKQLGSDAAAFSAYESDDVRVTSPDGISLHGILIRGKGKDTVILAHGYRSSGLNDFCGIALWYLSRDFSVLLIDQRSHGESGGKYITFGIRERFDMLEWIKYARSVTAGDIWLHGISMGASSLLMALPLTGDIKVAGVVADSTFDNVKELLIYQMGRRYHVPRFLAKIFVVPAACVLMGREVKTLYPSQCLSESGVKALVIHGDRDGTVPPGMHERFESIPNARACIIPGARHALCWAEDPVLYSDILREWMFGA